MRRSPRLERWLPPAALPLLALPALWPYTRGFPFTADGMLHVLRIVLLDWHVRHGLFFPRWVPELVLGYGYPVFNFYGPSTFYLAEALRLLGFSELTALMGTLSLLVLFGGWGMYLFARDVFGPAAGPWPALASAAAYMYAPYLLTNVFIRAAIGEVGAQALLPWIFWSFRRLALHEQPARWLLPAALSLGALACTHNITLIFLPPALLLYLAALWVQGGRSPRRLAWLAAGGLAAVGVSAFFWLPLIVERQYLAATAYGVARQFLAENAWTWQNFLDRSLRFEYTFHIPFQLGLAQLGLGLGGFLLARRRDAEWLTLFGIALAACLGIGAWAVPLWLSSDILLVAQFPWRLLVLACVPLALFTGGGLLAVRAGPPRWAYARPLAGAALVALVVLANRPIELPDGEIPVDTTRIGLAAIAQFEAESSGLGTSSAQEFMPRWVAQMGLDDAGRALQWDAGTQVQLTAASAYERVLTIDAAAPAQLRLTDFYYPGWQARTTTGAALPAYPSTSLGLLTVDVPAGTSTVRVFWSDTPLRQAAGLISVATLAVLASILFQQQQRASAALAGLLFLAGLGVQLKPLPAAAPLAAPLAAFEANGLRLLGYRVEQPDPHTLYLHPYWLTTAHPPNLELRWTLTEADGEVVAARYGAPRFGGDRAERWPAGAVVDDLYALGLPPNLPEGDYDLWLAIAPEGEAAAAPERVGRLRLSTPGQATAPAPAVAADAGFGADIALTGYDVRLNRRPAAPGHGLLTVRPGDLLEYRLYWRALAPLTHNYHGLIHVVDAHGQALLKRDQLAGSWFGSSSQWDTFQPQRDSYQLRIPPEAPGGVYWPQVGLYNFETIERLPVTNAAGETQGDTFGLAPIKVLGTPPPAPAHTTAARFDDVATLLGYDLVLPEGAARPGSVLTLTLQFRSDLATSADYTRFVHLYSAQHGMAGQVDSAPRQGRNPTWSWVPGEVIADEVTLSLDPAAAPGAYTLLVGLYDAAAGGARLTVYDEAGQPLPEGAVALAEVTLGP